MKNRRPSAVESGPLSVHRDFFPVGWDLAPWPVGDGPSNTRAMLMRKALFVVAATAALTAGLAVPASASNGLIYNENTGQCMSVLPNQLGIGAPVVQGNCNTYEAAWDWGSLGLLENRKSGLCLEVPNGGGYAYLQRCGGPYQNMDLAASTGLIGVHNDNRRLLGIDGTGRVLSTTYPGPNLYWEW